MPTYTHTPTQHLSNESRLGLVAFTTPTTSHHIQRVQTRHLELTAPQYSSLPQGFPLQRSSLAWTLLPPAAPPRAPSPSPLSSKISCLRHLLLRFHSFFAFDAFAFFAFAFNTFNAFAFNTFNALTSMSPPSPLAPPPSLKVSSLA